MKPSHANNSKLESTLDRFTEEEYARYLKAKSLGYRPCTMAEPNPRYLLQLENFEWFADWVGRRYGGPMKRSTVSACHIRLHRGRVCPAGCPGHCGLRGDHDHLPPHADHDRLWAVNGKPVAYTSEPYVGSNYRVDSSVKEGAEWAELHGLDFHVFDRSFWGPPEPGFFGSGRRGAATILLVFTAKPDLAWIKPIADTSN